MTCAPCAARLLQISITHVPHLCPRKAISAGVVTVLDERAGLEKELAGRRAYIFNVCVLAGAFGSGLPIGGKVDLPQEVFERSRIALFSSVESSAMIRENIPSLNATRPAYPLCSAAPERDCFEAHPCSSCCRGRHGSGGYV